MPGITGESAAIVRERDGTMPTPGAKPLGIARGVDGTMWFAESAANRVGRIAP